MVENAKKQDVTIQDKYLNKMIASMVPVSVYLKNGIQLKGYVISYDIYAIMLQPNATGRKANRQLVYKHSVATIVPLLNIEF